MNDTLKTIATLVNEFTKLPGVGQKTAQRYAYKIIDMSPSEAASFVDAIKNAKAKVKYCSTCGNFTDRVHSETAQSKNTSCENCEKENKIICVVTWPKDVITAQRIKGLKCSYHVLHGTISPLDNRSPDDIKLKELVQRLSGGIVEEVVLALNPDVEGETTGLYIARLLKPLGVKVTKLAQGISMGADLEYTDEFTLTEAYNNRKAIN